jgi:hypothetical protein
MKTLSTILCSLVFAAACGGKSAPASEAKAEPTTAPAAAGTITPEDCTTKGGQVRGDIGDGQVKCGDGERELGRVMQGIEGAICCAPEGAAN